MNNLCKYKDIFGKPNTGAHSYRFFNIAIVDMIATFIGAYLFSFIFKNTPVWQIFILLLFISIFVHKLFCVETTLTKVFF